MSAPKTGNQWGFGAKVESTYATINAPGVGDGVLLKEVPNVDVPHWINDGDRGVTPGGGPRQNVAKSGRWGGYKLVAEGIGAKALAAYSASVKPQLDPLILGSGFVGTGSFTGGQENWLYTPAMQPANTLTSLTSDVNLAGQLYRLYGAYADVEIVAAGPVVPLFNFDVVGLMDFVTDAAIPAYTSYPLMTDVPVKADNIVVTIGSLTGAIVKSFHFKYGRNFKNQRVNMASGGHAGYTPGYHKPTIEIVIERTTTLTGSTPWSAATTLNPYRMAEDQNPVIFRMDVGSTQYRRWSLFSGVAVAAGAPSPAAQAQLVEVKDTFEGPTATWTLTFEFLASAFGLYDSFAIMYR